MAVFPELAHRSFAKAMEPDAADQTRMLLERLLDVTRSSDPVLQAAARTERETIVRGLDEALQRAQDAGQLPATVACYDLAQALYSFYMGVRLARLVDPELDTDRQLAQLSLLLDPSQPRT
jgi:hypothetical protein